MISRTLILLLILCGSLSAQSIILIENDTDRQIFERRIAPDIIEPTPTPVQNLQIKSHHVTITVTDQVAQTEIDQIFYNPFNRQMEGHYLFPLPEEANVHQFSMWMNGKEVHAELLERETATRIYQSIVSRRRDPGLLELVGTKLLKVHVFPILAKSDTRIRLTYSHPLKSDSGMMELSYPINTSKFNNYPVKECSILVKIKSQRGLTTVYSPTHNIDLNKKSDHEAIGSWERENHLPVRPFKLYITESVKDFGIHGLMHRLPGEEGYFMMMVSPKQESVREIPKDVVFVIDTSGSMAGSKMTQTKAALEYCISKLKPEDRFNIVPFSTEARFFAEALQEGNEANLKRAKMYVEKLLPRGGTNINEALQLALPMFSKDRLSILLFLTDGKPTIGERDIKRILGNTKTQNQSKVSIFAFGAGNEINTELLDKLAAENHGTQEYVSEEEDIKVKIARFFDKLSAPVMTDLKLKFVGFHPTEIYPKELPNLFKGNQLLITGRFDTSGSRAVQLVGTLEGKEIVLTDELEFVEERTENDFVARIWANRKVGYLMEEIRTHGVNKELKEEIIRLGKKFGIVTPYTAFLAVEESELGNLPPGTFTTSPRPETALRRDQAVAKNRVALREMEESRSGAGAVRHSKFAGAKKTTDSMEDMDKENKDMWSEAGEPIVTDNSGQQGQASKIKMVGSKTFVRAGNLWVDSAYKAEMKANLIKVVAFSKEYFELIQKNKELTKFLSIGNNLIVVHHGKAYHITETK